VQFDSSYPLTAAIDRPPAPKRTSAERSLAANSSGWHSTTPATRRHSAMPWRKWTAWHARTWLLGIS